MKSGVCLLKSDRGFSIMEVLVAAGLLLIIQLAMSQFLVASNVQSQRISNKLQIAQLEQELMTSLSNSSYCTNQFLDQAIPNSKIDDPSATGVNIGAIYRDGTNSSETLAAPALKLPGSPVEIDTVKITDLKSVTSELISGQIEVKFKEINDVQLKPIKIPQQFYTQGNHPKKVQSCIMPSAGCIPVDETRPWIRRTLVCKVLHDNSSADAGDLVILNISGVYSDSIRYRHGSYSEGDPLGLKFDPTTGVLTGDAGNSNLDGGNMDCTVSGASLIDLSQNPQNKDEC